MTSGTAAPTRRVSVTAHYDAKKALSVADRRASPIVHLRTFNNWVKAVLLQKHYNKALAGGAVLDLGCGHGGDLGKFARMGVPRVVAVDISQESIQEAQRRHSTNQSIASLSCTFICGDFATSWSDFATNFARPSSSVAQLTGQQFGLVSCQFALHYAFETEARVRQFLANVAQCLPPGGCFVGTTTNADALVARARASAQSPDERALWSFGNSLYTVTFDSPTLTKFGCKLRFRLIEAIDDCCEFLVHVPTLRELAADVGLHMECMLPFHAFFEQHSAERALLRTMQGAQFGMTQEEWEAIGLYSAFVFRKL